MSRCRSSTCWRKWNGTASRSTSPGSRTLKERFERERKRVEQEIYDVAGEEFNINSNPKLREILFEKLQLPILKKTQTGPSTDASVLQQLADDGHPLPVLLMEFRELSKLESTYIDALPTYVHPLTHRVHTSFNQTTAATGRLASNEPNLQNIPIRRELGRDVRRGFVPAAGSSCSPRTTRRSSCGCSPICPTIPRLCTPSDPATTSIVRPRPASSTCRSIR